MTQDEFDVDPNEEYVTVASDGAYVHYLDGFVSLLFFQDKAFPTHNSVGEVNKQRRAREILHEVRLSINATKKLSEDIQEGMKTYTALNLQGFKPDVWHSPKLESIVEELVESEDNSRQMVVNAYWELWNRTNREGRRKIRELQLDFIHEKMEEIRTISEEYPKEAKKRNG